MIVFSDPVQAQQTLWIVGDVELKSLESSLSAIRGELNKSASSKRRLFSYQQYNIKLFHPTAIPDVKSPFARIHNALAEVMNDEDLLPSLILTFPEWSCLKHFDFYQFGASKVIGTFVNWLVNQVNAALDERRAHLKDI